MFYQLNQDSIIILMDRQESITINFVLYTTIHLCQRDQNIEIHCL